MNVKTYTLACPEGCCVVTHTVHSLTEALSTTCYDADRAAISLLQPGDKHVDVDGDVWTRVT